jgi:hypothetical protein
MTAKPWARQTRVGSSLLLAGASGAAAAYALKAPWEVPVGLGAVALLGCFLLHQAYARWRGKYIEKRAIGSLSWPEGWIATPNIGLPGGGDVDLLVEAPTGERFAIEIKAFRDVDVKVPFLGLGRPRIVTKAGRRVREDPVAQARAAAQAVEARPVLWFPQGRGRAFKRRGEDLMVVFGSGPKLQRALGLRRWSWF